MLPTHVERGDVYVVSLESIDEAEEGRIAKTRPAVVIDVEQTGWDAGRVTIVPGTSVERAMPSHVRADPSEGGLDETTYFICSQLRTVDLDWLERRLGTLSDETMEEIERHLGGDDAETNYEYW